MLKNFPEPEDIDNYRMKRYSFPVSLCLVLNDQLYCSTRFYLVQCNQNILHHKILFSTILVRNVVLLSK